jgi:phage major head subunit gpT-like protein
MFKNYYRHAALLGFAIVAALVVLVAPEAFAFGSDPHGMFTASAALIGLKADHTAIVAKVKAKFAEIKDGLAADVIATIEKDHATLVAEQKSIEARITAEETRIAAEKPVKPWASLFYASAESSGLTLADLNKIVLDSASHEVAKDALIDAMAKAQNADKPGPGGVTVGTEATEKFVAGATAAIIAKVPMFNKPGKPDPAGARNEFSGLTMRELARHYLHLRGIRSHNDPMQMVAAAFAPVVMAGAMSTSDFVNVLANVANKSMLKGYEESPETFQDWTAVGTLTDFKTASRVDLGLFPSLAKVDEGAEYSYASVSDRGVSLVLATYGKIFPITRQAIINDDLGAFTRIPGKMGAAAKRTIGNLVYAILTGNPNMADGVALFHATHKNLQSGAGSALSASSLDAGRALMGKQSDPDNIKQGLNIRPAHWIGPIALQGQANQIFASQSEPGQDNPGVANRVANMAKVNADARLDVASTTAWYLAADPSSNDTIEVSYLNGVQAPTLEQKEGWNVDGAEMKVRIDAGVNLLDFRGLQKSAGA